MEGLYAMSVMSAALVTALGDIKCDETPAPSPKSGKVLIKTNLASICGSDLHIVYMGWNVYEYPLPYGYPGHEGVGYVIDGGESGFNTGDLVLTAPNIWSSKVFAEYQLIDPQFLLKLPLDVPESHLLMAQQLGTVVYGCRRLPNLIGQTVVVIGQGSVGLFHDFMLRRLGAHRIIAIEPVTRRLEAGFTLGVDEGINFSDTRATEAVLDLTEGLGADLVIEAVGSVDTLNQSLNLVRPEGQIAVFGLPPTMDLIPFDWDTFFRKRIGMHTVFGAQDVAGLPDFQIAVDYIRNKDIDMTPFVTHQLPIDRVQEAFELAHNKEDGALKVSLTF